MKNKNTDREPGIEKILILAKFLYSFHGGTFSFTWLEENLKIKRDICLHGFQVLKEAKAVDFVVIPWGHPKKPDKFDKFIEKNIKTNNRQSSKDALKNKGIMISVKDKKILSKLIKTPSLFDPIINKMGIYPEKPYFNEKKSTIFFEDKKIKIPSGHQFILCKIVFSQPSGEWMTEEELALAIDAPGSLKGNRFVYDAMLAINRKVEKYFGIKNFMEWNLSRLRIRKELFG